ncbi:hypothetical protein [Dyadobacter frigoris]|uniref:Uncharacterized protein n=1 Tax=Dyadobacter frigoris TaxID=2576211 RepID=A0A4U6D975_9BACT|nr:hypothetical protein [Dyadobacter frigoris]TKT93326.1 hypothetical protein FDK13_05600 [Dyadobacter frigoris]
MLPSSKTNKGDLKMTTKKFHLNCDAPSHKILLKWIPNLNQSPVFDKIGAAWDYGQGKLMHLRFIVLSTTVYAIAEEIQSETVLKSTGLLKTLMAEEPNNMPSHVIKIGNVIVGAVWKQKFNSSFNTKIFVMGHIIQLIIQKV